MGGCASKPKDLDSGKRKAPFPTPGPDPAIANNAKFQSHEQTKADKKIGVGSAGDTSAEQPFVDAPETPSSPQADENGQQGTYTENKPLPLPPGKAFAAEARAEPVEKLKTNAKDDQKHAP